MKPVIVIHGGAWAIPEHLTEGTVAGVRQAAREGFRVLERGASALDAVEAAVRIMEDDPVFDAGHGAVLNADGDVELDAIIMDGKTLAAGAICCVKNISNPVTLARSVMEKTVHVMLSGVGASQFAASLGMEEVPTEELVTQHAKEEWGKYKYSDAVSNLFNTEASRLKTFLFHGACGHLFPPPVQHQAPRAHDTVGAVAIDSEGNLACATSTGGITNKMVGRVGDTPIIGSGGYADNQVGAVSATGHGESILKVTLSRLILFHMEQGESPEKAADKALQHMQERVGGRGGVIVIDAQGKWTAKFNTKQMAWASMEGGTLCYGLNPGEKYTEGTIAK